MSLPGSISLLARLPSAQSAGFGNVDGPASSTANAIVLFSGTTGKLIKNSDTTYVSPTLTVPDGYSISSAGAISLTAGAANKEITATLPSGTGKFWVNKSGAATSALPLPTFGDIRFDGAVGGTLVATFAYGGNVQWSQLAAPGTTTPTAATSGFQIGSLQWASHNGTGYIYAADVKSYASEAWSVGATGASLSFAITTNGTTGRLNAMTLNNAGRLLLGSNAGTVGTDGGNGLLQIPSSSSTTGLALGTRAAEVIYRTGNDALKTDSTWTAASLATGTPNGGTAGVWKMGIRVAATVILDTTQYIQLDVGGTLYKVAIAS